MRFFLSSTFIDLKDIRIVANNMLSDLCCNISAMEYFCAEPNSPKDTCLKELDKSDVLIGIYGDRYGSIDKDTGKSITELEYDYAKEKDIFILAFIKDGGSRERKQEQFIEKVHNGGITCAHFETIESFASKLNNSLKKYFNGLEGYNYNSIWNEIENAEHDAKKTKHFYNSPYMKSEIKECLDELNSIKDFYNELAANFREIYKVLYSYSYNVQYGYPNSKEDINSMITQIDNIADKIVNLWFPLHIGEGNVYGRFTLACAFLDLQVAKNRLLTETWNEDLRQSVIKAKDKYVNAIKSVEYYD